MMFDGNFIRSRTDSGAVSQKFSRLQKLTATDNIVFVNTNWGFDYTTAKVMYGKMCSTWGMRNGNQVNSRFEILINLEKFCNTSSFLRNVGHT